MKTKIIKSFIYALFFLFFLAFFINRGLPVQLIWDRITQQIQQSANVKVTAGQISTLFPNGVKAYDVRVLKEGAEGSQPLTFLLDKLSARISLFSLISSQKKFSFLAELLSGKMEGSFSGSNEDWQLEVRSVSLDLEKAALLQNLGIGLTGKVSTSMDMAGTKDVKATHGDIRLDLEQGKVGNGQIQIPSFGPITVPWVRLGKMEMNLDIQKGKADIKTLKIASDDLDVAVDGYFLLQQQIPQTTARIKVRFKFTEDFLNANEKFRPILSTIESAKGRDGFYTYSYSGSLAQAATTALWRPMKQ
jgi:type II secretion system protein N